MDSLSFGHGAVGGVLVRLLFTCLALLFAVPALSGRVFAAGDADTKGDAISPVEDFSRELDKLKRSFGELGKKMDDSAKAIDEYTDAEKARKEIEDLRAAVSGLLDAVADNGSLAMLGDKRAVSPLGEFFDISQAVIAPAPAVPVPVIVGGRSDAAVRRAGRLGDGWLGIWNSPGRFAAAVALAAQEAERAGRPEPPRRHGMQVWCGIADSRAAARACLAPAMEGFYQLPFERFEKYCPYGTAEDVAAFLAPYVAAGAAEFNLIPQSPDPDQAIAGAAAVRKLLASA